MRRLLYLFALSLTLFAVGCARMGSPDGGWFDDTPPRVVGASPVDKGVGVKANKITIFFDEFIKLEDAQNKVIVSPPQLEQPDIKGAGKRIVVELKDTLKENTTYTIDFSDAISDNNEGNPLGNYTYSFSTGTQIDTFEVSGYVLNAEDLEPIKGILVGVYDNLSDTVFRQQPMIRISRTDGRGHFTVKGLAPGSYRAYALQDADGNFVYSQRSEQLAFNHDIFEPSWKPDTRQDTIWRDSLHIDQILRIPYTHFLPDDITLMAFTPLQTDRFLLKTERQTPEKIAFYFTYGDEQLPAVRGLNFNADSAFVVEHTLNRDTVFYWLRDTMLVNRDSLQLEVQYLKTDTTGMLVQQTDTIEAIPKVGYEKRLKESQRELEKWQKEQEKRRKKGLSYDSVQAVQPLNVTVQPTGNIAPDQRLTLEVPVPLAHADTAALHLYSQIDSLWYEAPFRLTYHGSEGSIRRFTIEADWKPDVEYSLEADSAAFESIYGLVSNPMKLGLKVKSLDEFSTFYVHLSGISDTARVVVQLLSEQGSVLKQRLAEGAKVTFNYVTPGKYYLRAFVDSNGNGKWDTGDYDTDTQPEPVYYYPKLTECKAKWDVTRDWNLTSTPRYQQKPAPLIKQKADQERKLQNRNAQRAKQLGIEYIKEKTGVSL